MRVFGPVITVLSLAVALGSYARDMDVVVTPKSGTAHVAATIRDDRVSCRALYGLDSWIVWEPASATLSLVDRRSKAVTTLEPAAIKTWGEHWRNNLAAQQAIADQIANGKEFTADSRAVVARYSDGVRKLTSFAGVPVIVAPTTGAQRIQEFVDLQARLDAVTKNIQANLPHADMALSALRCELDATHLPAQYGSPSDPNLGVVDLRPVPSGRLEPRDLTQPVTLPELFTLKGPRGP